MWKHFEKVGRNKVSWNVIFKKAISQGEGWGDPNKQRREKESDEN